MLLKLENPKVFSDIIGIISELVSEVKLRVDMNGMSIIAIDPANVALVSFKLPASSFSALEAGSEVLGVSLDSLKNVLRRSSSGSSLVMKSEDNMLDIEIHDKITRKFSLALIEIESEDKQMPSLEFKSKVEMSSSDFLDSVEDCKIVADACTFSVKEGKFIVEAKGLNSAKNEFSGDEVKIEGQDSKSRYSLEYLQKFTKGSKISDKVKVNFSEDYPLKLEFINDSAELVFVLAPRVETED
ncbi:MAG: proliferating cell nuclear antigen (pcna) [Nanoarchaeota archaeon]|nr:proliferating cell nuclear antigen (pcna) [Nanoarchaeota archaeon]